jgi:hypothetical protein
MVMISLEIGLDVVEKTDLTGKTDLGILSIGVWRE